MSKVLLYSGGTDSWLVDKLWKPDIKLYININGRYSNEEIKRLPKDVKIIDFPFLGTIEKDNAIVNLRNLYFIMIATNFGDNICLGATLGDRGGKDKTPEFFNKAEDIINYCLLGNSYGSSEYKNICISYINKNKYELVEEYIKQGGDIDTFINETFSCYNPINNKECLKCKPCYRKFLIGYYFGHRYSKEEKMNMIKYLKKNIIPLNNKNGTYFTERLGEGKYAEESVDRLFKEYDLNWRDYQ